MLTHTNALPFYLCLAGPTASGKSQAALELAQHFPLEIISVDSALVYRGMSIGTAKPSAEERARVPHHLIDIADPSQSYSAAQFVADTKRLVFEIQQRGAVPLLVGGTMLYFKALQEGLDELPPSCPSVRADVQAEAQAIGWPALHHQLKTLDPLTAQRLSPQDSQRIGRALEVFRLTGRPLSSFLTGRNSTTPRPLAPLVALEPQNRTWLHQRIQARLEQMWTQGWAAEVQQLYGRGDLNLSFPSMRCVGYRQIWQALEQIHSLEASGQSCPSDLKNRLLEQAKAAALVATRQLAKRQLTWLRAMPHRHVIACDGQNVAGQLLGWVRQHMPPLACVLRC